MRFDGLKIAMLVAGLLAAAPALAQDKPTVTRYLEQGYDIVRAESGGQFMQFILRKGSQVVWCSVLIMDGKTTSCRTVQ
jgi:hypothetical protein